MSTSAFDAQLAGLPPEGEAEILAIHDDAGNGSLQVALLVALVGLGDSFRMRRLPDVTPSATLEGIDLG